jgi:RNA polymerase primary sigma factor
VRGGLKGIVEAVTGTGKTRLAAAAVRLSLQAGARALVVVPSIALLEQWIRSFRLELGLEVDSLLGGKYGNRYRPEAPPVTIGVVNSVANVHETFAGIALVVVDECHRCASPEFRKALLPNAVARLGLTATLERSDEGVAEVLLPYFSSVVFHYGFSEARRDRVIAPYGALFVGVRLSDDDQATYEQCGRDAGAARRALVHRHGFPDDEGAFMARVTRAHALSPEGRLAKQYLAAIQKRKQLLSEAEAKLRLMPQIAAIVCAASRTLVFCESISGARRIQRGLELEGVRCAAYHSKLPEGERGDLLDDLTSGVFQCLVAVHALDEGIDVSEIDCGILVASSRQSRQLIQRMGRVLRRKADARGAALVVVYAENTAESPDWSGDAEDSYYAEILANAEEHCFVAGESVEPRLCATLVSGWIAAAREAKA